jgi:hypothetical protein
MKTTAYRMAMVHRAIRAISDGVIEVHEKDPSARGKQVYGVNWGACGTVSPEATYMFAKQLNKVASITKVLNIMEIEVDYRSDDDPITEDQFNALRDDVMSNEISANQYGVMKRFIETGEI